MRISSCAVLSALLCVLGWWSACAGLADATLVTARDTWFGSWSNAQRRVDSGDWNNARNAFEQAHRYEPRNPNSLEALAELYDWAAFGLPAAHEVTREYLRQMAVYLREALHERPVSGYAWANLALTKSALGETDAELSRALRNAATLGPWEPAVQLGIVRAGLTAWPELDTPTRDAVVNITEHAMLRHSREVTEIAQRLKRADVLCSALSLSGDIKHALCAR